MSSLYWFKALVDSPHKGPVMRSLDIFFFILHIVELPVFRDTLNLMRRHSNQWSYWQSFVSLSTELVYCEWHRPSARLLRFQILSVRAYCSSDLLQIQIVRSLLFASYHLTLIVSDSWCTLCHCQTPLMLFCGMPPKGYRSTWWLSTRLQYLQCVSSLALNHQNLMPKSAFVILIVITMSTQKSVSIQRLPWQ